MARNYRRLAAAANRLPSLVYSIRRDQVAVWKCERMVHHFSYGRAWLSEYRSDRGRSEFNTCTVNGKRMAVWRSNTKIRKAARLNSSTHKCIIRIKCSHSVQFFFFVYNDIKNSTNLYSAVRFIIDFFFNFSNIAGRNTYASNYVYIYLSIYLLAYDGSLLTLRILCEFFVGKHESCLFWFWPERCCCYEVLHVVLS